jgi:hypothetical protein
MSDILWIAITLAAGVSLAVAIIWLATVVFNRVVVGK